MTEEVFEMALFKWDGEITTYSLKSSAPRYGKTVAQWGTHAKQVGAELVGVCRENGFLMQGVRPPSEPAWTTTGNYTGAIQ